MSKPIDLPDVTWEIEQLHEDLFSSPSLVESLGKVIQTTRTARGITQQKLADRVTAAAMARGEKSVPREKIALVEIGRRRLTVYQFVAMALLLDMTPQELYKAAMTRRGVAPGDESAKDKSADAARRTPLIARIIRDKREAKGLTHAQVAAGVNQAAGAAIFTASSIEQIEGEKIFPTMRQLSLIAAALSTTREEILAELSTRHNAAGETPPPRNKGIPVINRVPAGPATNYEEYGVDSQDGYEYIDRGDISEADAFALDIVGDSMEQTLREGDRVIFVPATNARRRSSDLELKDGRVVCVRFTEEEDSRGGCTVARAFFPNPKTIILRKDNPKYAEKTLPFSTEFIARIAVAVERRTKINL